MRSGYKVNDIPCSQVCLLCVQNATSVPRNCVRLSGRLWLTGDTGCTAIHDTRCNLTSHSVGPQSIGFRLNRTMPLLHEDRLFPADPEVRRIARRIFSEIGGSAHPEPARAHRSALVCRGRAFSRSDRAVPSARPLHPADALQPGDRDGDTARGRRSEKRAGGLAAVRGTLSSLSRNADAPVARLCLSGAIRAGSPAQQGKCRSVLGDDFEETRRRRVSAPRAIRPLPHRGACDDG